MDDPIRCSCCKEEFEADEACGSLMNPNKTMCPPCGKYWTDFEGQVILEEMAPPAEEES